MLEGGACGHAAEKGDMRESELDHSRRPTPYLSSREFTQGATTVSVHSPINWRALAAPAGPRHLAVLAGAGVSLNAPSNLLDGASFMRHTLRRAVPRGLDPALALSVLNLPNATLRRPGEMLRFELLMHSLVQHRLDPQLTVLNCFDACESPNANHFALAELIHEGAIVVTTNFDRLIEIAWHRLYGEAQLEIAVFNEDFPPSGPDPGSPPTLWKIHGSLSVDTHDTRRSVQATMASALSTSLSSRKARFLASVLRSRDAIVVGYSGWDDFDIVPIIGNTTSRRRLTWIDHAQANGRVIDATQALAASSASFEIDAVGRDRVWFIIGSDGEPIRDAKSTICASANTALVLDDLVSALPSHGEYSIDERGFAFGTSHPQEVDRYFDEWERSLESDSPGRYDLLAEIHSLGHFRPGSKPILERATTRARELRRASHDPGDMLTSLIEDFNADAPIDDVRVRLEALTPELSESLVGSGKRLGACIAWQTEGAETGHREFQEAAATDRAIGNHVGELSTLVTWRGYAGFAPWGDNIPTDASRRIDELANDLGYLPVIWQQELLRHTHFIDEHGDIVGLGRRLMRMRRHSVDVGDVLGEAISGLQLGRVYLLDQQPGLAMEEFLRVQQLNRVLRDERLGKESAWFMNMTAASVDPGYVGRLLPAIRKSLWAGRDRE